jgi:predicted dehydrogenase
MSDYSRRQFLHNSLLAAASAAAAHSGITSHAEEGSSFSRPKSPNEKLAFAVMGCHGQGKGHIKSLLENNRDDSQIVAICDVDSVVGNIRCDEIEKAIGRRPKYYQDLRKLLDDKSIDCVSMATPNHWHALGAIWAMRAGKHVYVEKPASYCINEGRSMVEAARKFNRICQTGTQSRSQPGTIDAIRFIKEGGIGDVTLARGICFKERTSIGPKGKYDVPAHIDYDLWRGPAPLADKSPYRGRKKKDGSYESVHYDWHWVWDFGNGDLGNQGVHEMDVARWGLGVDKLANGVITYGGRFGYEDAGETPNTEVAILD